MKKIISLVVVMVIMTSAFSFAGVETTEDPNTGAVSNINLTAEKAKFSVTVPTAMPVLVKAEGNVIGGNATIVNGSAAPVKITAVNATAQPGWTLVAGDADLKAAFINSKKLGLVINGVVGQSDGTFVVDDAAFPVINVEGTANLTWGGIATSFEEAQAEMTAATVIYTIGFAK